MFHKQEIELTESVLAQLLDRKYTAFLDSNFLKESTQEQSIIGLDPVYIVKQTENSIIVKSKEQETHYDTKDLYSVVQQYIKKSDSDDENIFCTGFIGMFSYEAGYYFENFNWDKKHEFPVILGGIYDRYIIIDHSKSKHTFVSSTVYNREIIQFNDLGLKQALPLQPFVITGEVNHPKKKYYHDALKRILKYINEGDVYQVNFSVPYSVSFLGKLSSLYLQLRQCSPAPYSAYFNFDDYHVLSSSPELFFQVNHRQITTKPIKGTIARGKNLSEDDILKERLMLSKKDNAELLMIVDLERNDLNKICKTGSVNVKTLREIESYHYVHHGVSTIEGELRDSVEFSEIMTALFPGGSITGAPKQRAMEIIQECETGQRGPYTGCLGYVSGCGRMAFNIAIRTFYSFKDTLFFHAGGGIVADSVIESEWQECLLKAQGLFDSLKPNN